MSNIVTNNDRIRKETEYIYPPPPQLLLVLLFCFSSTYKKYNFEQWLTFWNTS